MESLVPYKEGSPLEAEKKHKHKDKDKKHKHKEKNKEKKSKHKTSDKRDMNGNGTVEKAAVQLPGHESEPEEGEILAPVKEPNASEAKPASQIHAEDAVVTADVAVR